MFKNNNTKSKLITLSCIVVALLGVYFYIIFTISSKNESFVELKQQANDAVYSDQEQLEIKKLLKETENDRVKIDSYFVPFDQSVNFIEDVESTGRASNIDFKIESVTVKPPSANPEDLNLKNFDAEYLNLKLTFTGGWQNVYQFLLLLETMPYKIYFRNVSFSRNDGGNVSAVTDENTKWVGDIDLDVVQKSK